MGSGGSGTPLPLSGEVQGQIIELRTRWKLAVAQGFLGGAEIDVFGPLLERNWDDQGLLCATVDLVATALAGTRGQESKRFLDKIGPLKRRRKQLELVWRIDPLSAA